jgi:lipopolysaccharide export system ATP-binding protein
MLVGKNLSKFYNKKNVVKDISISVNTGEIIGILGPNGAGKTTSFLMLAGVIKPCQGEVLLNGENITHLSLSSRARKGIGYLPQDTSVFQGMSVSDNILTALEIVEHNLGKRLRKLEKILEEFSISHLRHSKSISLSGGERRKLELARCFAISPTYLLLDEPFAGIDPISINSIVTLIRYLSSKGIGILITDHNVKEALGVIDKAYVIFNGKVIAFANKEEISQNQQVKKIYLGNNFF